jgi:rare lipoprotein A
MKTAVSLVFAGFLLAAPLAQAGGFVPRDEVIPGEAEPVTEALTSCYERPVPLAESPAVDPAAVDAGLLQRLLNYAQVAVKHRVNGLASYYSTFFDGRRTANGEVYRNAAFSAAHLTLPLGTWLEVKSRATGRTLRLRVNDRGPYAKKFCLDLSQAAAHFLGVDVARDRHVDFRIIALPGEEPLPEGVDLTSLESTVVSP